MDAAKANVTRLSGDARELGEGPHYDRATGTAFWLDITGKALIEHRFAEGETQVHALPRMASVVARIDAKRQVLAMDDGLHVRDRADGALTPLLEIEADNPATRSNDGRVHPSGRLWIGTMGCKAEKAAGTIYWSDGREARALFRDITIPNGICFTPDGATGYFADSTAATVWRVALDAATGLPKGEPEVFLTSADLPPGGAFDGSVIDADGVLWNAVWGAGLVNGYDPSGARVRTISLPAKRVTCPCFVGAALDSLLVTSAFEGYDAAARAADPLAGHTFVVTGGFRGMADAAFRLD